MMMSVLSVSPFTARSSISSSTMTANRRNNNNNSNNNNSNKLSSSSPNTSQREMLHQSPLSSSSSLGRNPSSLRSSIDSSNNNTSNNNNNNSTLPPRPSVDLITTTNSKVKQFTELLYRVREGLKYHDPELCEEGVNGTYFLKDKNGKTIAVFKPQDEEGSSENNPKRNYSNSTSNSIAGSNNNSNIDDNLSNKGILPGEAALREVAAYLLDHESFYGVPKTQLVRITHSFGRNSNSSSYSSFTSSSSSSNNNSNNQTSSSTTTNNNTMITKIGSLQEFIDNDGSCEDFGPRSFPINEVHKIGILDIIMANVDRHAGNILIKKTTTKPTRNSANPNNSSNSNTPITTTTLVPIDQGFSLPDTLEGLTWFEWMNWPQSKVVFDDDVKSYIQRIDIDRDLLLLKKELNIRSECLMNMKYTTILLKKAVEYNLTLYDIGLLVTRKHHSFTSSMLPTPPTSKLPSSLSSSNANSSNNNNSSLIRIGSPSPLEIIIEKTKKLVDNRITQESLSNSSSIITTTTTIINEDSSTSTSNITISSPMNNNNNSNLTITTIYQRDATNDNNDSNSNSNNNIEHFVEVYQQIIEEEFRNRFPSNSSSTSSSSSSSLLFPECKYYTPSTSKRN